MNVLLVLDLSCLNIRENRAMRDSAHVLCSLCYQISYGGSLVEICGIGHNFSNVIFVNFSCLKIYTSTPLVHLI